jgi:hypothetical protein
MKLQGTARALAHRLRDTVRARRAAIGALAARKHALGQLDRIRAMSASPFARTPAPGWMRGIDFYDDRARTEVLLRVFANFKSIHGTYPDLIAPRGLNEKIIWAKFFQSYRVPETGNKLLTPTFIPDELRASVGSAAVRWRSTAPRLPPNDALPDGFYYLKANHGSDMYRRIRYPLSGLERVQLESLCAQWLNKAYGIADGEWWYNAFPKEVFLEDDVVGDERSISYNFFAFAGAIEAIVLHEKGAPGTKGTSRSTRLDPDFRHDPVLSKNSNLPVPELSATTTSQLLHAAQRIGKPFPFARIDFFVGRNEDIHLAEITVAPGSGYTRRPQHIDMDLGRKWLIA